MPPYFQPVSTRSPDVIDAIKAHYPGSRGCPPGKKLVWRIWESGTLRGWIGIGEPPYKLAPRRRLEGNLDARPFPFTVCCFLYRLEVPGELRASNILKAWHDVAASQWTGFYGWEPLHWETMVDPAEVATELPGYCFRRAGYRPIGLTTGRTARRPAGHGHGVRVWSDASPKLVLYRGPVKRIPRRDDR